MSAPQITFSITKSKLGPNDYISVTFSSDIALKAFEARATLAGQPYGVGVGSLVGAFSSTPANTERIFEIYDTELVSGDGTYRISLYGQSSEDDSWNDNTGLFTSTLEPVYDSKGDRVLCIRTSHTQESYSSAYSGAAIDSFIGEVLM